jgi:hypothetical protein
MFDNPGVIARAMIGAVAGFFIGPIALIFLYVGHQTIPPTLGLASVCLGVCSGAAICAAIGARSVPPFWVYLVLVFGAIALFPCVYVEKSQSYGSFATLYLGSPPHEMAKLIFMAHALVSIVIAAIASRIHRRCLADRAKATEGKDRAPGATS